MATTTSGCLIDIPNDPSIEETARAWNPYDWLKQGKVYPSNDTPPVVLAGRQQTLSLCPKHTVLLPEQQLSIIDLLRLDLPTQPSVLVVQQAMSWFHTMEPNEDIRNVCSRPLPPVKVIQDLQKAFGQAWFDGAQSIIDPHHTHSRLPLFCLE
ncbi:hypothetical protein EW026_g8062 [Hermanssonia centrifuga]|uniref:Uncharacterized protein n=1 Tax=Hermanssonia centrifuga TaxID=98765 RepID=A0A4S4K5N7_9APHY|nr:hypothetical protein EW026_g8062 [Hermanssonia centrifuga]